MVTAAAMENRVQGIDLSYAAVTGNPVNGRLAVAIGQFRLKNRWLGGARSRSTILRGGSYMRKSDTRPAISIESGAPEPARFDGESAPHPVEFMLHGLAASLAEAIASEAEQRGVELDGIESRVDAQFERSLFTGDLLGCRQVRVKVLVECDAPRQKVQDVFIAAVNRSPALTMLGKDAPVIYGLTDEMGAV